MNRQQDVGTVLEEVVSSLRAIAPQIATHQNTWVATAGQPHNFTYLPPQREPPVLLDGGNAAETILQTVAAFYLHDVNTLLRQDRTRDVAQSRQVAMYLVRELLRLSWPKTGVVLQRDQATAIHGWRHIAELRLTNQHLNAEVAALEQCLVSLRVPETPAPIEKAADSEPVAVAAPASIDISPPPPTKKTKPTSPSPIKRRRPQKRQARHTRRAKSNRSTTYKEDKQLGDKLLQLIVERLMLRLQKILAR